MSRIAVIADDAPVGAGPYSPAVRAGDFLYLSGIGALNPVTHEILGNDINQQTRQTMSNIKAILKAGGATLDHIVQIGVYLQNPDDYETFNAVLQNISHHRTLHD